MSIKIPYQPLPPLLVAAIAGILTDRFLALSALLWAFLCFATLAIWFVFFLTEFTRFSRYFSHKGTKDIGIKNIGTMNSKECLAIRLLCELRALVRKKINPVSSFEGSFEGYCLILIACAAFFGFWHHDHWYRFASNDIGCYADSQSQPAALMGKVVEMPRFYPKPPPHPGQIFEPSERTVFTLCAEQLRDGRNWIPVSGNVLVTIYDDGRKFRIGDRLQLFGELIQPPQPSNPGDFHYQNYLRGHRTRALLRCSGDTAVSLVSSSRFSLNRLLESVRRAGLYNLEKHLSSSTLPIAEAMIFGVRESVDNETWQNMLDTGTMHLLSISGMHITLIAGIVGWFLRQLRFSRRVTAITMILFVLFYLCLTDVRPPAIRATALTCSIAVALYVSRPVSATNILCASALVVLLVNPAELFQFGAQLSFIAVGCFLWIPTYVQLKSYFYRSPPTDDDLQTLQDVERVETTSWRWLRWLGQMFRLTVEVFLISVTIWLVSTPLLLQNVNLFTPVAILVNPFLWIPLAAAMGCGFVTAMLGQIPLIGSFFGIGADWSFWILLEMIVWFQRLGGHYWMPGPPGWWNLGFYAVFAFFTFVPVQRPRWRMLLTALVVWILLGIGAGYYRNFDRLQSDRLTLTVLSVGHGNSVLITTPEKRTIICDVGNLNSPHYVADSMSRSLWRLGKTHIDAILISHPDNDHFNGIMLLAERFSIGAVLISPYFGEEPLWLQIKEQLEAKKIPLQIIGDGDNLAEYGLPDSVILHPPKAGFEEQNNSNATSLVLRLEHRGVGILLPGDLDGWEPSPFLRRAPLSTEIVMVPHHGGRSMQTELLLDWASPQTLIFSAGKLTHKPEILDEYRQQGYEVRSTLEEGAIEINIEK